MTNLEKYFEELKNIKNIIAIIDDKPVKCVPPTDCEQCKKYIQNGCCSDGKLIEWLAEEYVESVTLNKKERMFCELIETGYIARDRDGTLYWYKNIPNKRMRDWYDEAAQTLKRIDDYPDIKFEFIKWEDKEPWSVEDLLKLEVAKEE